MSDSSRLQITTRLSGCLPHYYKNGLVVSRGNRLFRIDDLEEPELEAIGKIPWTLSQQLSRFRTLDRVLKNGITLVHPCPSGNLVTNAKAWWLVSDDGHVKHLDASFATRPLARGVCTGDSGCTYIAEYNLNPHREPVRIWRTTDFQGFEVAWEFPAGTIRHVHAVIADPNHNRRIWVLTGDLDSESRILFSDDDFKTLETYLSMGQRSRTVDLVFANGRLIWGMDSPDETAYILSLTRDNIQVPETLSELPGPAYYAMRNQAGGVYFGTTVEPGDAVRDDFVHIISSTPDGQWQEIYKAKTDIVPQYAIVRFPSGLIPDNWVVFSQRATSRHEGSMFIARDLAWTS